METTTSIIRHRSSNFQITPPTDVVTPTAQIVCLEGNWVLSGAFQLVIISYTSANFYEQEEDILGSTQGIHTQGIQ